MNIEVLAIVVVYHLSNHPAAEAPLVNEEL
jgi:hypothetical protein